VSFGAGADFAAIFTEKPANGLSLSIRFENRAAFKQYSSKTCPKAYALSNDFCYLTHMNWGGIAGLAEETEDTFKCVSPRNYRAAERPALISVGFE
jgi:hypothetical protein